MKFLITGVSGLIGRELALKLLKDGHEVHGVTRQKSLSFLPAENIIQIDLEKSFESGLIKGFDVIINLAGHPVAEQRWTDVVKQKIKTSRIDASKNLIEAINRLPEEEKPKYFVGGSAIGVYGSGFLSDITKKWEAEYAKLNHVPYSIIRTGIVLSRNGGALAAIPPVVVGNGQMTMSWIHIQDWINACLVLIEGKMSGAYNFTAPTPVTQKEFIKSLVSAKGYPTALWTPFFVLEKALGERASVLFESLDVRPNELKKIGYTFVYSSLHLALKNIYEGESFLDQSLFEAQYISKEKKIVFDFFSDAKNLEKITPDFLNFKIVNMSTTEIQQGTLINYVLKLHGLPIKWKTLISRWSPETAFVDEQLSGPYKKWHHTHEFFETSQGTLITDKVIYRLPLGLIGLVALPFVKKDVNKIFNFRKKIINETFNQNSINKGDKNVKAN